MPDYRATARIPTRPLSYEHKEMAYRKELLVDYVNGMVYIIDQDGNEHDVSSQVYNQLIKNGDITKDLSIIIQELDKETGEMKDVTVSIQEALAGALTEINSIKNNMSQIQVIINNMVEKDPDTGEPVIKIDPSDIVEDATHKFLTQAQLDSLTKEKITIKEVLVDFAVADITGSAAPYTCTKTVTGVDPSYPRPIIDISYKDSVYANNNNEEDAFFNLYRCTITTKNQATFYFKDKPKNAFRIVVQIKIPGIS